MPGLKNYGCESSDSCSLMSVTGLSTNSKIQLNYSTTDCSESCEPSEVSSCSEATYSDKSSASYISEKCYEKKSKCEELCERNGELVKCSQIKNGKCVETPASECSRLVKKYNCSREELLAISDIIVVLNFIKSKLTAVQPNVVIRDTSKYAVEANIAWLECFVDTLFCVLRKNEAYKVIKVKDCKLINDNDVVVSNRTYIIEIKYHTKCGEVCNKIPLTFEWTQLTNNTSKSYNAVLNMAVSEYLDNEIKAYQAKSTLPFLC